MDIKLKQSEREKEKQQQQLNNNKITGLRRLFILVHDVSSSPKNSLIDHYGQNERRVHSKARMCTWHVLNDTALNASSRENSRTEGSAPTFQPASRSYVPTSFRSDSHVIHSDRTRYFSNRCDISKVAKVVRRNRS